MFYVDIQFEIYSWKILASRIKSFKLIFYLLKHSLFDQNVMKKIGYNRLRLKKN